MKGNAGRCGKQICHWTRSGECAYEIPCVQSNPDTSYVRPGSVSVSNRGFKHMEILETSYGHTIRCYESSSIEPSVWMKVSSFHNTCGDIDTELSVHMTIDQAEKLRDTLTFLIEEHWSNES